MHDSWKNRSFDYMDLCQQRDVSAFQYTVQVCRGVFSKVCVAVYLWEQRVVCEGLAGSLHLPLSDPCMASPGSVGLGTRPLYQEEEAGCA